MKEEENSRRLAWHGDRPAWGALPQVRLFSISSLVSLLWELKVQCTAFGTTPVPEGQRSELRGERGAPFPRQYVLERAAAGGCLYRLHFTAIAFRSPTQLTASRD